MAFAETAGCPENPAKFTETLRSLGSDWGMQRVELRWGFDGDALMSVTRLVAPKPRKPALALLDEPAFDKTSLLPMPDGVESFVELSMSFAGLLETIKQMAPTGPVREQIDELAESIHTAGSIDLQKDLLAHLGPKMLLYLAPGRSAATNDDSLEAALSKGWNPSAAVAALQSVFPRLTVVAQVKDPTVFGKALDAAMIAINGELKAQAIEIAAEQRKEEEKKDGGGAAGGTVRAPGGRPAAGRDGTKRRRSVQDTPAPKFQLAPGSGDVRIFVLQTPLDSPLRFGPTAFRPTVQLDGHFFAFSVSQEAARAALAAVRRKDWKLSALAQQACENLPAKVSLLSVTQVNDSLSSLLASLPGTLQTMINTSIALAKGRATEKKTADNTTPPSGPVSGPGGGRGGRMGRSGGFGPGAGGGGRLPGSLPGGGFGGGAGAGGATPMAGSPASPGAASDSMVVLKVESDKLPKTADLKGFLFASTLAVTVTDQDIQLVSRGAFPNLSLPIDLVPVAAVMPALQSVFERMSQAGAANEAAPGSTPPAAAAQPGGAGAAPGAAPGQSQPGGSGNRRGGRPRGQ